MPKLLSNPAVSHLMGLHLWHAPLSSCSQRVRITLAEQGRAFESHIVNLEAGEHAAPAYQAIHPDGLVPALVEDGDLWVESIDIIQHLAGDLPKGDADLLALADGAQRDLKLLTFEFLFRGAPRADDAGADAFQRNHRNAWLKAFYRDFRAGFDHARVAHAVRRTAAALNVLEARLADGRAYVSGDVFSLADIAWMPNAHRYDLMGWPYDRTPNVAIWMDRMRARGSYDTGLMAWQPPGIAENFAEYTETRRNEGSDVRAFMSGG